MKELNLIAVVVFFFQIAVAFSQSSQPAYFYQDWTQNEALLSDGSPIYDSELLEIQIGFNFFSRDSVQLRYNGMSEKYKFSISDKKMFISDLKFEIISLTETELVLKEEQSEEGDPLMFKLIPKKMSDLTYSPEWYKSKSGEIVYRYVKNKLEPIFLNKNQRALDYVFERFGFNETKKGEFVVRFVVTKNAELKGIKIIESSNDKYNAALVNAVLQTTGKWESATYMGEKINLEVEYEYVLGNGQASTYIRSDSLKSSSLYFQYGQEFFTRGAYDQAAIYLSRSIDYNPLNIDAYYLRANAYHVSRDFKSECADYRQLIILDQKRAVQLFEQNCKNRTTTD